MADVGKVCRRGEARDRQASFGRLGNDFKVPVVGAKGEGRGRAMRMHSNPLLGPNRPGMRLAA